MESIENIAAGYAASGGYGGPAGATGLDNLDSDDRGIAQLAAAQRAVNRQNQQINTFVDNFGLPGSFNNLRDLNRGIAAYVDRFGAQNLDRATFNQLRGITAQNPGGRNTVAARIARGAKNRLGIGTGQVETNAANAGRLTGTVFQDGVISKGGVMQGVPADVYYGDRKDTTGYYAGLPRYTDKGYLGAGGVPYANPTDRAINRQYDQFMNPYNAIGEVGYNPDVGFSNQTLDDIGQVRPGLRSTAFTDRSGTPTRLGEVVTYDRDFSGKDNIAMSLTPFGIGYLARMMSNPVSGIEGRELPAAALAPTEEMLARGETSGGMMRSFGEAIGQGVDSLGNIGQGFVNAGTNLGDALTNAGVNTADALTNAGVNTVDALRNAGVNIADLFRSDPAPQVVRQLDDAPLDENMYGSGMFDLGTMPAPVPQASITRIPDDASYYEDFRDRLEQSIDQTRPLEDVYRASDRRLNELEQRQLESLERRRQLDAGTTFNQLPPNDVFNYFTR